ncbi:c-type cytochrome [Sphingobacterium thalpophilum]|uniref:c-type cytochrome n=1 Tax=Sphingobacterium thalpophilum TaxID=259 RepID=UPI0024A78EF1|nr:c-type cytochrome [Sphingobacterium thalpophilum]
MKHLKKIGAIASVFAIALALSAFNSQQEKSQQDPKPTNLKVLPKNISHDELIATMKEFNVALGVKCGFCHAPSKEDPKKLDFASDENPKKEIGRAMIKMTQKINKKYFNRSWDNTPAKAISCKTCHGGKETPEMVLAKN